MKHWFHKH